MRLSKLVLLLSSLVAANMGDILVDFDPALEGRVGVHRMVEEVVGHIHTKPQFSNSFDHIGRNQAPSAIDARSLLGRGGDLVTLVGKRQSYCDSGYGYCSSFDACCLDHLLCCGYGYCIEEGRTCCPNGSCGPNERCCGRNNCYPRGGDCCSDGSYCYPGNNCYRHEDYGGPVCCTNSRCTAFVDGDGSTSYASTSTTTRTTTITSMQYYYWTVTWWYWYYYWTYSVAIEASIVTSSRSTTTSVFSIETTDASAASSYFSDVSETMDLPTPASATRLESLAGRTSFLEEPSATPTDRSSAYATSSSSSIPEADSSTLASESTTDVGNSDDAMPSGSDGASNSAARALWSSLDGFTLGFLTFGVAAGVTAVLL